MRSRTLLAAMLAATLLPLGPAAAQVPDPFDLVGQVPDGPATLPLPALPGAVQDAIGCDPIDPSLCMLPFPNDRFTVADAATDSGRRISFLPTAMPRNGTDLTASSLGGEGKPVEPVEWNRSDGYSPGQAALTLVPGLDLHQTWGTSDEAFSEARENEVGYFDHRDHIADVSRYLADDAPIVILNADTGERHPFWSELDTHAAVTDARRSLILRPTINYDHGARYIVALRDLRDAEGEVIPAGPAFAAYRDGSATDARAAEMDGILTDLADAGIDRDDLYLAWDFTIISGRSMAERMLHIRDDAFAQLGDTDLADRVVQGDSPAFEIVSSSEREDTWRDSRGIERTQRVRRIDGRVTVPNYLDRPQHSESLVQPNPALDPPVPGSRLYYGAAGPLGDALPQQNPAIPTVEVPFRCDVPVGDEPSTGVLYGHGLLGTRSQVGDVKWPRRFGFAGCAMDWWGMATGDVPTVAAILADISNFPSLPDRTQQGFLNWMFLGRAMVHPQGLVTDPAFQGTDGSGLLVVDTGQGTDLAYDGNSQGGILGGALVAVSPDISRGVLGVTGGNYSTLLNRSVDWEGSYGEVYYAAYQDPIERQLGMQLIQMLWDRGESNGYAAFTSDNPLPNTPPHDVLLQIAYSDHQVSIHAAEVNAATVGAPVMEGLAPGRHFAKTPFAPFAPFPHKGSALVYWDSDNVSPPNGNTPATHSRDPHGDPRNEPAAAWQEAHFLRTGWTVDVCDGAPPLTLRHPANAGTPSCIEPAVPPGTASVHLDALAPGVGPGRGKGGPPITPPGQGRSR